MWEEAGWVNQQGATGVGVFVLAGHSHAFMLVSAGGMPTGLRVSSF